MIKYLKAEIRREKAKNELKRSLIQEQKTKNEQRLLSKTLVSNFKNCIDTVLGQKEKRVQAANPDKLVHLGRANLNDNDRKKVLEMFVENDDALGQLLDFISNHYIQGKKSGNTQEQPSMTTVTSNRSGPKASVHINAS